LRLRITIRDGKLVEREHSAKIRLTCQGCGPEIL
jgi:hypothetical protein